MHGFTFETAPAILFGAGRVREIGTIAAARGVKRALVITDKGLVAARLVDPAIGALVRVGIEATVFDEVVSDPPESTVLDALGEARDAEADCIIGFGGGSSLDVAKLVALLATGADVLDRIYGVGLAKGPRLPLIQVPTTAGTGSEVTPVAVVTTGAHEKKGVVSRHLLPDVALLDPETTYHLPHAVTAATGIDAMVHAIEAYTSAHTNNNPISQLLAKKALKLLGDGIRSAVREGSHPEARAQMMLGAMLAGQAFANSPVSGVHALAYPLGGRFQIAHGQANALVLAPTLRFNAQACGHAYGEIAPFAFPFLAEIPNPRRAEAFTEALEHLMGEIGLATRLREVGIPRAVLPDLAVDAMSQTRLLANNPRPMNQADALAIYEAAW